MEQYQSKSKIDLNMLRNMNTSYDEMMEVFIRNTVRQICNELPLDKLKKLFGIEIINPTDMENNTEQWKKVWDIKDDALRMSIINQYERLRYENRIEITALIKI